MWRHRGRSALVLAMVGLPVLLLTVGAVLALSLNLTRAEKVPLLLGSAEAIVAGPYGGQAIEQDPTGNGWGTSDTSPTALPVPGIERNPTAAVAALLRGTAIAFESLSLEVVQSGSRGQTVPVLAADLPAGADLGGRAHLLSGRWPAAAGEVVVTRYGHDLGLPIEGTVGVRGLDSADASSAARTSALTVVGTADAMTGGGQGGDPSPAALVLSATPLQITPSAWLVTGRGSVEWSEVRELNRHALVVTSKAVALTPDDQLPRQEGAQTDQGAAGMAYLVAGASGGLLITTVLLAAPAFAVSASRSRRLLALAAANGATPAQIRRMVLGQSLVLGSLAAVGGVALGLVAFAGLRASSLLPSLRYLPVDVPAGLVAALVAAAVLSAVLAALLPARALGRLDIVRAMRGQEVPRPVRHRVAGAGLVTGGVGAVIAFVFARGTSGPSLLALMAGSALVTVGSLLLVPTLLALAAQGAGPLPLSLRMAARDSGRQRSRTAPTVAAILAGAAVMSAVCVTLVSDTARRAATYTPRLADGMGQVQTGGSVSPDELAQMIHGVDPSIRVMPSAWLGDSVAGPGQAPSVVWGAVRTGCTPSQALLEVFASGPDARCASLRTDLGDLSGVRTLPADDLVRILRLGGAAAKAVRDGALVVPDVATRPLPVAPGSAPPAWYATAPVTRVDVVGGAVRVVTGKMTADPATGLLTPVGQVFATSVRALVVPAATVALVRSDQGPGALISSEAAASHGWSTVSRGVLFDRPSGTVDGDTESAIGEAVNQRVSADVYVERGFQRDDLVAVLVVVAIVSLLILVATFVATALSLAEQQPLMGTLAAVGATRGTRRRMAAAQALHLGALGAILGAVVGLVPGIAVARAITTRESYDAVTGAVTGSLGPFIEIPWLQVLAPVVVVPLLAASFAWLAVRRSPQVTRRMT